LYTKLIAAMHTEQQCRKQWKAKNTDQMAIQQTFRTVQKGTITTAAGLSSAGSKVRRSAAASLHC
jgi:hypothetical protein